MSLGAMNDEYSQQGGLKLPLNGLALRRAFKARLKCWRLLGRQRKTLQGVFRPGLQSPSANWEPVAKGALATPDSVQAAAAGHGESHSVETSSWRGHVSLLPMWLDTAAWTQGKNLLPWERALEMGCWLRQALT